MSLLYSMNIISLLSGPWWLIYSQSLALLGSYLSTLLASSSPDYSWGPGAFMAMLAPTIPG